MLESENQCFASPEQIWQLPQADVRQRGGYQFLLTTTAS